MRQQDPPAHDSHCQFNPVQQCGNEDPGIGDAFHFPFDVAPAHVFDAQKQQGKPDEITPAQLKSRMDKGDKPFLVDVRNANELDICKLPYDAWIPLPEFGQRWEELAAMKDKELVIYCRSGGRSGQVVRFLKEQGFKNPVNMIGGMLRWSDEVDPTSAKY